jgi:hypothetical protein
LTTVGAGRTGIADAIVVVVVAGGVVVSVVVAIVAGLGITDVPLSGGFVTSTMMFEFAGFDVGPPCVAGCVSGPVSGGVTATG